MPVLPPIQSSYTPTLPELLAPRLGGLERARTLVAAAVIALVAIVAVVAVLRADADEQVIVHSPVATFNFRYQAPLKKQPLAAREIVHLQAQRGGLFLASYVVRPLRLPPYRGDTGAVLPLVALARERELAKTYTGFTVVGEGRQRVNGIAAYQILYEARLGTRHLYGRLVMLPQDHPGARTGIELELLATPASGAGAALSVGNSGALALPFRSLRFGTEGA